MLVRIGKLYKGLAVGLSYFADPPHPSLEARGEAIVEVVSVIL